MTFNISTIDFRADSANTTGTLYGDAPTNTFTAISKDMPLNRANLSLWQGMFLTLFQVPATWQSCQLAILFNH
jgi:hypothetical protein